MEPKSNNIVLNEVEVENFKEFITAIQQTQTEMKRLQDTVGRMSKNIVARAGQDPSQKWSLDVDSWTLKVIP